MRRIVAALLLAALFAPTPVWAQDEETAEATEEAGEEGSETVAPEPVETRWYHRLAHYGNLAGDVLLIRPLAGVTAFAGAVLFVPAAIFTAPNGMDSLKEAYERFVREPGEYFATRPLGEF